MAPYIRKARHRRFNRFRYSLKFLTWLERQALRVGMPARTLYNDYLVNRLLSFEQVEGLPNGLPGGGSGLDYAQSWLYFSGASAITGTDSAVESVVNSGNGGYNLARVGTGAEVTRSAAGFTFANARRLTATSITTSGIDGVFIMIRATISAYSGAPSYVFTANPPSGLISIYDSNGALQARYHDGATRNIALGATPYGTEFVVGLEINNQTGAVRTYDLTGTLASLTPAGTPGVLFNTINAGQVMTGTIHEVAIFTKPVGGAFAYTFEQVFADFQAA